MITDVRTTWSRFPSTVSFPSPAIYSTLSDDESKFRLHEIVRPNHSVILVHYGQKSQKVKPSHFLSYRLTWLILEVLNGSAFFCMRILGFSKPATRTSELHGVIIEEDAKKNGRPPCQCSWWTKQKQCLWIALRFAPHCPIYFSLFFSITSQKPEQYLKRTKCAFE